MPHVGSGLLLTVLVLGTSAHVALGSDVQRIKCEHLEQEIGRNRLNGQKLIVTGVCRDRLVLDARNIKAWIVFDGVLFEKGVTGY